MRMASMKLPDARGRRLIENLSGQQFDRLVVKTYVGPGTAGSRWLVACMCGGEKIVLAHKLKRREVRSCGCLEREARAVTHYRHGMSRTRVHNIWCGMLSRCLNPNVKSYKNYGGRGVTVCDRWRRFENFYADMGEPGPMLTIDRVNPDGNYEPGNCRWTTIQEQQRNRRKQ